MKHKSTQMGRWDVPVSLIHSLPLEIHQRSALGVLYSQLLRCFISSPHPLRKVCCSNDLGFLENLRLSPQSDHNGFKDPAFLKHPTDSSSCNPFGFKLEFQEGLLQTLVSWPEKCSKWQWNLETLVSGSTGVRSLELNCRKPHGFGTIFRIVNPFWGT